MGSRPGVSATLNTPMATFPENTHTLPSEEAGGLAPESTVRGGGGRTEPRTRTDTADTGEGETSDHPKRHNSKKGERTGRRED